jgi:hypothetical protein
MYVKITFILDKYQFNKLEPTIIQISQIYLELEKKIYK